MGKITREKFKTMHNVFDNHADRVLFKLITEGHFEGLIGQISMGKEANVFAAKKGKGKVVVKIYRLETCDYTRMYEHICNDPRYMNVKRKRRLIVFAWCQREFRNLMKAREAGMNVPLPITFKDNVLVMEHIGKPDPAPKLKDHPPKDITSFYQATVKEMALLHNSNLVHADLSPFNILNDKNKPVIIDMSQSTPLKTQGSKELFERDCKNMALFFSKHGLEKSTEELSRDVLGFLEKKKQ